MKSPSLHCFGIPLHAAWRCCDFLLKSTPLQIIREAKLVIALLRLY
jgi:hypothetical protein